MASNVIDGQTMLKEGVLTPNGSTPATPPSSTTPTVAAPVVNGSKSSVQMDSTYTNVPSAYMTPELKTFLDSQTKTPQNSNPNTPSSSASLPLAVGAANNTQSATTAAVSANVPAANSLYNMLTGQGMTGISISDLQGFLDSGMSVTDAANMAIQSSSIRDAKADKATAEANQSALYNAELASQNAQYASASATLNNDKANAKSTAMASLASLNASGGIGSDSGAFMSHIDATFDLAQQSLNLQAAQAQAALAAGNATAYANIQANMQNTIATAKTNIGNILSSIGGNKVAAANQQQVEQDKNAALYKDTLTQLPLAQADNYASLPSDVGKLSDDQLASIKGTTAYQQGHKAGLSDQAIFTDLRTLSSTPSFKQQQITNTANAATARLAIAQANLADKQSAMLDANTIASTPKGSAFLDAFGQVNAEHSKQQNTDFMSSMARFLQVGNTKAAGNALTNYVLNTSGSSTFSDTVDSLRTVAGIVNPLIQKIQTLPADQQSGLLKGTYQEVAARLGQNPDPQLQTLGSELAHMGVIYARAVGGVRAAASTSAGSSIFGQLLPNIKDTKSLMMSDLTGFTNTSNDLLNSAVSSKIGSDTFSSIYGAGGVLGGAPKSAAAPTKGATQLYNGANYTFDGTQWVKK